MERILITITGLNHYLGMKPFKVNRLVKLAKEPVNPYDPEAIRVELPFIDTIGYVANSVNTVYVGTYSAGRLYDKFEAYTYAQVMVLTRSSVIAVLVPPEEVEAQDVPELPGHPSTPRDKGAGAPVGPIGFQMP